jgi:exoribonuclease-2
VSCYAWITSPLRRYVDLVNQWQLAAALSGRRAPFSRNSEALLAALRAFEVTYAGYDQHQRTMETYWALRYLLQERILEVEAQVLRENLVRLDALPLATRVTSMPELAPGTRVRLAIKDVDLIEATLACAYRETIGEPVVLPGEKA